MIGGLMKTTTSRLALAAIASVIASSAMAADLGGNCCADLEERIAELEATTARKGNRKVSLTVSGHVNEMLMFWDDGDESNIYIGTNQNSRTRFRFVGSASINSDWSAGYLLEIGVVRPSSSSWNQLNEEVGGGALDVRHSAWYLDSKRLGRVWLGHTSAATDGITEINLSNAQVAGFGDVSLLNGAMFMRAGGTTGVQGLSALTWGEGLGNTGDGPINPGEGARLNVIKYVSPAFAGFTFQAAWGEDDYWDAALRYAGEFNGVRVAAGIGYQNWTDGDYGCANAAGPGLHISDTTRAKANDCDAVGMSASAMHVPTGLYIAAAYGWVNDDNRDLAFGVNVKDKDEHWYIQAGLERNFFGLGATTFYGEYFRGDYGAGVNGGLPTAVAAADPLNSLGAAARIASSELEVWGLGVVQAIDAAAMHVYLGYRNYSADLSLSATGSSVGAVRSNSIDDFSTVIAGGIIRF